MRFMVFAFLGFTLFVVGGVTLLFWLISSAVGAVADSMTIGRAAALLVLFGLALSFIARGTRRVTGPVGDVIEAAGRLEAGDYGARVRVRGPRVVRTLGRAFNTMASRLETSEQERRRLLADVSHELRTPLAVVQGNLEGILDGVYPADSAHITTILEETKILSRLIEDLRTLSLAEVGALTLHREATDLGALAREVAASFSAEADPGGVTIETRVAEGSTTADVDPVRTREIVSNLLANAVRYSPRGGKVVIEVSSTASAVAVQVTDDGPGIAPDVLPHLFERFAKSPESRGAGLGLAIAKGLVSAHGGEIAAESVAGKGTTIRFTLPREVETARG
jgi:signal transduction histidine kinase